MSGAMEYAQARLQARHGARAPPQAWAGLHAATTLAALLDQANATSLDLWVAGLDAAARPEDFEPLLRQRLRDRIAEVARWMPDDWKPAILWTRVLLDLPALQRVAFGLPPTEWMTRDEVLAPRLGEPPDDERARRIRRAWLETWRSLWPATSGESRLALEEMVRVFEAHLAAFEHAAAENAWELRRVFQARLETLFRRHVLLPAAAFEHLALAALEAERLRAELIAHATRRAEAA